MAPDTSSRSCRKCGREILAGPLEGLCPVCLVAMNLATQTGFGEDVVEVAPVPERLLPSPEEIAHLFPHLEILECLGRGGMGVVYKARQISLDRLVALKLLAPERGSEPVFAERFQHEARALARLNHPSIVTVHDFGIAGTYYFLLMEFVDGVNLRQLLRTKKLSPAEALAIVPPLCEALQYAHQQRIVHRDIKPENLLLDWEGRVKIADFGIAKLMGDAPTTNFPAAGLLPESSAAGGIPGAGTPGYMAPEQTSAPQTVDGRADIYSLGVVFYEMLTGQRPHGPIEPPSRKVQIDVRLDDIVLRALEQTPELRWQSAAELRTQLETLAAAPPVLSARIVRPSRARHWRRGALFGSLIAMLIIALSALLIVLQPATYQARARILTQLPSSILSTESLKRVAEDVDLKQRWAGSSEEEIQRQLPRQVSLHLIDGQFWELRVVSKNPGEAEELAGKFASLAGTAATGNQILQPAEGSARLVRPTDPRIVPSGLVAAFLAGALATWIFARWSERRAEELPPSPPGYQTTAPFLALSLVLASFLMPVVSWLVVRSLERIHYAAEFREHQARRFQELQAVAVAQKRVQDLGRKVEETRRELFAAGGGTEFARGVLERLTAEKDQATADLAEVKRRAEAAAVRFHSRVVLGPQFYCLPALLFAIPGTMMGWQHLLAIRGWSRPRYAQLAGLWASLSWPVLLIGATVALVVLLPLNQGRTAVLGLILALMAFLGASLWMVRWALRWVGCGR